VDKKHAERQQSLSQSSEGDADPLEPHKPSRNPVFNYVVPSALRWAGIAVDNRHVRRWVESVQDRVGSAKSAIPYHMSLWSP
jgi:hypothetical protein